MSTWDQATLERVVDQKHGAEKAIPKTDIVCKFFLEAIEKNQYGWFWECPNGGAKCHYRVGGARARSRTQLWRDARSLR